jgi:hypothetical protein
VASLEKATNDDTQSEDRRGLLMKAERSETRAQKMEQQVRIAIISHTTNGRQILSPPFPLTALLPSRAVAGEREEVRARYF